MQMNNKECEIIKVGVNEGFRVYLLLKILTIKNKWNF